MKNGLVKKALAPILIAGTCLVASLLPSRAEAKDVWVDDDYIGTEKGTYSQPYNTIQEGVNYAVNGDKVKLKDGTYKGEGNRNISWVADDGAGNVKHLIVESQSGYPENCVINCEGTNATESRRGFYFNNTGQTKEKDKIKGIKIENGKAYSVSGYNRAGGGGVLLIDCGITFENVSVDSCSARGLTDGGSFSLINSDSEIRNSTVSNCNATHAGGAFGALNSTASFYNCRFENNLGDKCIGAGVGYWGTNSSGEFFNNFCSGNKATWYRSDVGQTGGYGGALDISNSAVKVYYSTFVNNTTLNDKATTGSQLGTGGAIYISGLPSPGIGTTEIKDCISYNNIAKSGTEDIGISMSSMSVDAGWNYLEKGTPTGVTFSNPETNLYFSTSGSPFLTSDGHLMRNSPCKNAGCKIEGINTDIEGDSRPNQDGKWSIGCDEPFETAVKYSTALYE